MTQEKIPIKTKTRRTIFHKLRRIFQFLHIQIAKHYFQGGYYILRAISTEFQPTFCETLIRKIRRVERKGRIVKVEIWMSEKVFSQHELRDQILLKQLGVRLV